MKAVFYLMTLMILFPSILSSATINEQIQALQGANLQERVMLMNSIKEQLVSMNAQKRSETMAMLREKLQAKEPKERPKLEIVATEEVSSELNEEPLEHNIGLSQHNKADSCEGMTQALHQHRSRKMHRENNPSEPRPQELHPKGGAK